MALSPADVRAQAPPSRFDRWDRRATVRVKPQPVLGPHVQTPLYFPPELMPAAAHPLVTERGEAAVHRVLIQRLYQYLHFTVELEQLAVIPIAAQLARGRSGLDLPETMRADAFKIATDEAWHAQLSYGLIRQVEAQTSVPWIETGTPAFAQRLAVIRDRLDPRVRGLERLLFAVVSETLISTYLTEIPKDDRLPEAVRTLVRDHAEDEGRHHAYFRDLLFHLWPVLDAGRRHLIGPELPAVVMAFVEPDRRALAVAAGCSGLTEREAVEVTEDSFPMAAASLEAAARTRAVVRYFTEAGALDDSRTHEAFAAAGLV